jgi:hypothetical protein
MGMVGSAVVFATSVEVSARFVSAFAALLQAVGAQVGTGLW